MLLRGAGGGRGGADKKFAAAYDDWQTDAKAAARTIGVARFTANMYAITAARVELIVEVRQPNGAWARTEDPRQAALMEGYRNDMLGQGPAELMRFHAWHYQVAGEGLVVNVDGSQGTEWLVLSTRSAQWDKPAKGQVTFMLTPGGAVKAGEAFVVPRDQAVRYWMPDEEFAALAVSPMTSAMSDLRRWQDLTRYAQRVARNYLAMNGMVWTPKAAHEADDDNAEDDDILTDAVSEAAKKDPLVELYQQIARTSISDDDRLESVVPPLVWWGEKGDEPKWVKIGEGLDGEGIAHRAEALADWARGVDAPGSIVASGGGATANHWNEWLNEERFLGSVAPLLDRMTHQDLTAFYLRPIARLYGMDADNLRASYDATEVIVHPDKSAQALRAWLAGLLGADATLRELGFDVKDKATDEDLERLALVLSRFAPTGAPPLPGDTAPVGPATTDQVPPAGPPDGDLGGDPAVPPAPVPSPAGGGVAAAVLGDYLPTLPDSGAVAVLPLPIVAAADPGAPPPGAEASLPGTSDQGPAGPVRPMAGITAAPLTPSRPRNEAAKAARAQVRAYRKALDRIAAARRDAGRQLLAGAEVALADVLRLAGVRAVQKARTKSRTTATALEQAWRAREPIGSHLAALGVTEDQLLVGAFDSFHEQAQEWLRRLRDRERKAITDAGFDADAMLPEDDDTNAVAAAGFLAAALLAVARQRIRNGTDVGALTAPGEVSGTVPAQFAAQALKIAEGTATFQPPTTPDVIPTITRYPTGRAPVTDYLAAEIRDRLTATLNTPGLLTDDPEARARLEAALEEAGANPTEYAWVHGFYGEPTTVFEPHLALDGHTTVDPEGDPALYNAEAWPDNEMFFPGDHEGGSCEWVALLPTSIDSAFADATS